jgi:hypothetical protein
LPFDARHREERSDVAISWRTQDLRNWSGARQERFSGTRICRVLGWGQELTLRFGVLIRDTRHQLSSREH